MTSRARISTALRSMTTLTHLERYHGSYAWGQAAPGRHAACDFIRKPDAKTGNPKLMAEFDPATLGARRRSRLKAYGYVDRLLLARFFCSKTSATLLAAAALCFWRGHTPRHRIARRRGIHAADLEPHSLADDIALHRLDGRSRLQCRHWWIDCAHVVQCLNDGAASD